MNTEITITISGYTKRTIHVRWPNGKHREYPVENQSRFEAIGILWDYSAHRMSSKRIGLIPNSKPVKKLTDAQKRLLVSIGVAGETHLWDEHAATVKACFLMGLITPVPGSNSTIHDSFDIDHCRRNMKWSLTPKAEALVADDLANAKRMRAKAISEAQHQLAEYNTRLHWGMDILGEYNPMLVRRDDKTGYNQIKINLSKFDIYARPAKNDTWRVTWHTYSHDIQMDDDFAEFAKEAAGINAFLNS